jgi:hypothetical protein
VWTWGSAFGGLFGDGSSSGNRARPGRVPDLSGVTRIAVGAFHTMALKNDGTLWVWGLNSSGQLGDGTQADRPTPVRVPGLTGVVAIAAGGSTSVALKADGSVWAWGSSSFGELGDGTRRSSKVPIQIGSGFSSIAAGRVHVLAAKPDGSLWTWGWNRYGQLGDGTLADNPVAGPVVNATGTAFLSLSGGTPGNTLDPYRVLQIIGKSSSTVTSTLTDLRAQNLAGEIYFTALLPSGAVSSVSQAQDMGSGAAATRTVHPAAVGGSVIVGAFGRNGFKQTGGNAYVQAESAYNGDLGRSGTLAVVNEAVLQDSTAVICMGVTTPELSVKGQVLMRPIATGTSVQGVVQCPPVQTAATIAQFRSEASGPITARTIVAVINPLPEDRGRQRKVFSWAVAPNGRQYMQTGPNQWEDMTEPMKPAATITVPATGPFRLEVTKDMNLAGFVGTLVFVGIGESWEDVRKLNKAGHYYSLQ